MTTDLDDVATRADLTVQLSQLRAEVLRLRNALHGVEAAARYYAAAGRAQHPVDLRAVLCEVAEVAAQALNGG